MSTSRPVLFLRIDKLVFRPFAFLTQGPSDYGTRTTSVNVDGLQTFKGTQSMLVTCAAENDPDSPGAKTVDGAATAAGDGKLSIPDLAENTEYFVWVMHDGGGPTATVPASAKTLPPPPSSSSTTTTCPGRRRRRSSSTTQACLSVKRRRTSSPTAP